MKRFFLLLIFVTGFTRAMQQKNISSEGIQYVKLEQHVAQIAVIKGQNQYTYRVTTPPLPISKEKEKEEDIIVISPPFFSGVYDDFSDLSELYNSDS